ncbi:hypothetical protein Hdeb2414_s0002g00078081 [Helianthus debilis subsp. tardiflorus]
MKALLLPLILLNMLSLYTTRQVKAVKSFLKACCWKTPSWVHGQTFVRLLNVPWTVTKIGPGCVHLGIQGHGMVLLLGLINRWAGHQLNGCIKNMYG